MECECTKKEPPGPDGGNGILIKTVPPDNRSRPPPVTVSEDYTCSMVVMQSDNPLQHSVIRLHPYFVFHCRTSSLPSAVLKMK